MTIYKNYFKDFMKEEIISVVQRKMCLGIKRLNKKKNI